MASVLSDSLDKSLERLLEDWGSGMYELRRNHTGKSRRLQNLNIGFGGEPADKVSTSYPLPVTRTVCSHCAERL